MGGGKPILRREGDELGGPKVHAIGWDRVWLTDGSSRCQSKIGAAPPPASPASPASPDTAKRRPSAVPEAISSRIQQISPTEFNVDRSAVAAILANPTEFMKARVTPEKEGGKVVGVRLSGIRPDSLLGKLGMENGDRLSSVNGFDITDPQKALEAYSRLQMADHLIVSIHRGGKPMNLDFNIK